MEKRRNPAVLFLVCGLFTAFLADAGRVRAAALDGLSLCAASVVPALFPFLAVSGLLVSLGFGEWVSPLLSGCMTPLFHLPGTAGGALVLGLLGGYPVGAKTAADLYRRRLLTRDETERLLAFCNNASPAYFISVLGAGVFGSTRTGVWLYLVHLLSALLTGLLFRGGGPSERRDAVPAPPETPAAFFPAFVEAVAGAAGAMVRVCGFVVFFRVLSDPLSGLGGRRGAVLTGLVELFSLTPLLTPDRFGFIAASALAGFGGLGVLCQTAAVLDGSGLPVRTNAAGKAVQGVLAGTLGAALSLLLYPT